MLEVIRDAIAANQAEAATYAPAVRVWMAVMALSFLSSVIFIVWKAGARWILVAFAVNIFGLILIKALFPNFTRTEIGTLVHLIFWSVAILMIWRPQMRIQRASDFSGALGKVYKGWLIAVSAIMLISLIFDARTALLWII